MGKLGQVIKDHRRYSRLTQEELADKVGISKAAISQIELGIVKPTKVNYNKIKKVLKFEEPDASYFTEDIKIVSEEKKTSKEPKHGYLPYYDMIVTASATGVYSDEQVEKPLFYMDIPIFRDCTLYHKVSGDSMFPRFKNGDIVPCKRILNKELIMWGEPYMIVTVGEDYRTIKYLHPGLDNKVLLVSENPKYNPVEISANSIDELYLVRGNISSQ